MRVGVKKYKRFSQRDNVRAGSTCFPSAVCVALSFHAANMLDDNFDNYLIKQIIEKENEEKNWLKEKIGAWTWRFAPYQVFAWWERFIPRNVKNLKAKTIKKNIKLFKKIVTNRPLVAGTNLTDDGHVVCIVAYDDKKEGFYVVDSWGKSPYKTDNEKNFDKEYFIAGYDWLTDYALDIFYSEAKNDD